MMTPMQIRFCEHYASTLNATKSAILAGYSPNTAKQQGSRLLTYADVAAKIAELVEEEDNRLIAEAREVLRYLTSVLRDENAKPADRLKAAEDLGRFHSLFKDKAEVTVSEKQDRPRVQIYLPAIEQDDEE